MTKNKNQGSKINKKENSLSDVVRSEMIGKQQIPGKLKNGNNFCISGLIINHFAPDIDIEGDAWSGITQLVNRYPKYFSEEHYSNCPYVGDLLDMYVFDFKQYYKNTNRINLKLLVSINDTSFSNMNPFTFEDFANLFQEIGIKIEQLDAPITKYKEDNVLSIDNIQLIEDKPLSDPILNSFAPNINIENMNVNLDSGVLNSMISNYVAEMLSKQRILPTTKPSKDIIKTATTEHKNV